ncbi:MAG: haloacid dehalogenase-like hydrolase [Thermoprotei archaeon]|nr:MAG: haloacid dehalogenase-like hydrolase [Thermoprotei archaeon]
MRKRLLTASPKEILAMSKKELLEAIRLSEGRVVMACARCRGPNLVDGVSNAEVVAAFGADIVLLDTYDVKDPCIPGLPSKNPADDEVPELRKVQIKLGRGWTLREIRELIGRPVGVLLTYAPEDMRESLIEHYGNIFATRETARIAAELGADIIYIGGWGEECYSMVEEIVSEVGKKVIIEFGRPHGPGLLGFSAPLHGTELITEKEIKRIIDTGVDIIGLPAPGTYPGWTIQHASHLVKLIHDHGVLASLGIHTSQEGSNVEIIQRIGIYAKMAGADIIELGDSGFTEQMVPPENIMALSIAIKGRRHTYRRMAFSILR